MNKVICGGFNVGRGLRANGKILELLGKIPQITDEDEGKVLGVEDGELAWVNAKTYLSFTAVDAGSTVTFSKIIANESKPIPIDANVKYSTDDGVTWNDWGYDNPITLANVGDKIMVCGNNPYGLNYAAGTANVYNLNRNGFVLTGKIGASGDVLSLISEDMSVTDLSATEWCFVSLFANQSALVSMPSIGASKLGYKSCMTMFSRTSITEVKPLSCTILGENCYQAMFTYCDKITKVMKSLPAKILAKYCYNSMFAQTSITTAPKLLSTNLADYCYAGMFDGCKMLIEAPELPAEILTESCYSTMFMNCESLAQAPELPATALAKSCYNTMFYGCKALTQAPELPATTLAEYCYFAMFQESGLTEAPELPATTLAKECYDSMFNTCASLTKASALPATELANYCYYSMYLRCTSLTEAPELPATVAKESCYMRMFMGAGITSAPQLPAMQLAKQCYSGMFQSTKIAQLPELPATELAVGCYSSMFANCEELVDLSDYILPATIPTEKCYSAMFQSCVNLLHSPEIMLESLTTGCMSNMFGTTGTYTSTIKTIKVHFTEWDSTSGSNNATYAWTKNRGSITDGKFYCPAELPETRDNNHIPASWEKIDI